MGRKQIEAIGGNMKISFDYDGTLTQSKVQKMAKFFVNFGDDVYIITARNKTIGGPVLEMAKKLNIPESNVFLTGSMPKKIETIMDKKIDIHFDNNKNVVDALNMNKLNGVLI
jgi:acid phosphatase class B